MLAPGGPNLNPNQFKPAAGPLSGPLGIVGRGLTNAAPKVASAEKAVGGAAIGAARTIGGAAKAVGRAEVGAAKAIGRGAVKAAPYAAGAALAPVVGPAAAAYGASQTPGGRSILKGAVQGAKGPNMGFGIAGAVPGAVKGAVTSQGGKNVLSGMGKGALIGSIGGPVGAAVGAGIGAIGGLFSNRGMKPKAQPAANAPVPNRATPYVVKKGDTLTSIAAANKTTVAGLRKANPALMNNPKYNKGNMIWSGTKVNLG